MKLLWIQRLVQEGFLLVRNAKGIDNAADMCLGAGPEVDGHRQVAQITTGRNVPRT